MLDQLREAYVSHERQATAPGFWAVSAYRFGRSAHDREAGALRTLLVLLYRLAYPAVRAATGIELPWSARVGRRLRIHHGVGVVVHGDAVIGDDVLLESGVTIGVREPYTQDVPTLGDRVYVGAGARILGSVHVGDDAVVGANAVVIEDVPPGALAVGVPAVARPRARRNRRVEGL